MTSNPVVRFWGSAVIAAALLALAAAFLLPYEWLGMVMPGERRRAWLLTMWTGGVFSILFGISTLLGTFRGVGVREVADAGSVAEAVEKDREAVREARLTGFHENFGWWLVSMGVILVLTYFVGWLALR